MAFLNANVKESVREGVLKAVHPASGSHGRCDSNHAGIFAGKLHKDLPEDILIAVRGIYGFDTRAGCRVKLSGGVPCGGVFLCGSVTCALTGMEMKDTGAAEVLDAGEDRDHLAYIVPVNWAEIPEPEGLEKGATAGADKVCLGVYHPLLDPVTELSFSKAVPYSTLHPVVGLGRGNPEEVVVQAAKVLVYGDVVVVEDDKDIGL